MARARSWWRRLVGGVESAPDVATSTTVVPEVAAPIDPHEQFLDLLTRDLAAGTRSAEVDGAATLGHQRAPWHLGQERPAIEWGEKPQSVPAAPE